MCGITGFYNLNKTPADPSVVERMADLIRHRGPDDQGFRLISLDSARSSEIHPGRPASPSNAYQGAIGFNRLSILDLSEHGHQPMCNGDGTVIIAYNGEIYNAFDYTDELIAAGFRFRGRSDTEVVLYLYERHGFEGMLERLNGMFAIVITDLRKGEMLFARDHLGVKPFYWWKSDDVLLFGSEVKSFYGHPSFRAELENGHLEEYLAFRYCAGDRHLLKGVRQLQPGCMLRLKDGVISSRRYWDIPDGVETAGVDESQALDELDQLLRASVQSQLLSDVKVGCQLSGGIDSSLVCAFARSHFDADMDTFSVVFGDAQYSEEPWISQAAIIANADSHRFMFTERVFFDTIQRATWHLDQPLNHPNSLGIDLLARKSRGLVTVLLSGEGADELFGGYPRYCYAAMRPRMRGWSGMLHRMAGPGRKMASALQAEIVDDVDAFIMASAYQSLQRVSEAYPSANVARVISDRREAFPASNQDHIKNCLKYDQRTYLVDLLVRQDKMTMAHSLENRVPFLDRRILDFVRRLPSRYLVGARPHLRQTRMRNTKMILKRLALRVFDQRFVYRAKSGFSLPLAQYFQRPAFRELMEDQILPSVRNRGLFQADVLRQWWTGSATNSQAPIEALWIYVAFELWAARFLDSPPDCPCAPEAAALVLQ